MILGPITSRLILHNQTVIFKVFRNRIAATSHRPPACLISVGKSKWRFMTDSNTLSPESGKSGKTFSKHIGNSTQIWISQKIRAIDFHKRFENFRLEHLFSHCIWIIPSTVMPSSPFHPPIRSERLMKVLRHRVWQRSTCTPDIGGATEQVSREAWNQFRDEEEADVIDYIETMNRNPAVCGKWFE